jgi:hypothetical protein
MKTNAVLQGTNRHRLSLVGIASLAMAALCLGSLAESASAARLVGKDGKVYACYRTKGKEKGIVRLVAKRQHCRRGEKKISWNVTGAAGESGQNGSNGESGGNGESGTQGEPGLQSQVTGLTNRVETLEGKLKGITNTALTGVISKLGGVSAAQLQEAVTSVADVNALCVEAKKMTEQVNSLGTALGAAEVIGGLGLGLLVPGLPTSLPAFGCP